MARRRRDDLTLFDIWFEFLKDMPAGVGPVVAVSAFLILRFIALSGRLP